MGMFQAWGGGGGLLDGLYFKIGSAINHFWHDTGLGYFNKENINVQGVNLTTSNISLCVCCWWGMDVLTVGEEDVSPSVPWRLGVSEVIDQTLDRLTQQDRALV